MKTNKTLSVKFQGNLVGTLASMEDGKIAFEYADRWYKNGFAISPFSLPLEKKVWNYYDGNKTVSVWEM